MSYFNSIEAQIFDRDGNRVGNEFMRQLGREHHASISPPPWP